MSQAYEMWVTAASMGWKSAEAGEHKEALMYYQEADDIARQTWPDTPFWLNPELSLLRHTVGYSGGLVRPYPLSENEVVTLDLGGEMESEYIPGMKPVELNPEVLKNSIRKCMQFNPGYHLDNITKELPHVMVMSTGRCGSVSLYRLFEQSNFIPYHAYFFQPNASSRFEMMCRLTEDKGQYDELGMEWTKTRAAEWIGCNSQNRPMMALNHLDTIYAPIFAAIHSKSKFIYLRRDPVKIFESFYTKEQWGPNQLCPLFYKYEPFRYLRTRYDRPAILAWYIRFTEIFSRAMGEVLGDRFIEISSDKLFDQDPREVSRLLEFTCADMALKTAVDHFGMKYNEKAHKITMTPQQIENGAEAFKLAYERLL